MSLYKVHSEQQFGGALENMPHIGHVPLDMETVHSYDSINLPTQNIPAGAAQVGQVVTWEIPQDGLYTDLSKSYVRITGRWYRQDYATVIVDTDNCAPAVSFPDSLFNFVNLYLNGSRVSPGRAGQPYIQFVNRLLLGRSAGYESDLRGAVRGVQHIDAGMSLDYYDTAALAGVNTITGAVGAVLNAADNLGFVARHQSVITTSALSTIDQQYIYQPDLAAWKVRQRLPDRISIRLELTVNDSRFYVVAGANPWAFQINTMELILHRVRLRSEVSRYNNENMLVKPWYSPSIETIYQTENVSAGLTSADFSSVYQGPLPKMIGIAFQTATFNGLTSTANPFFFDEGASRVNQLYTLVNGRQYPERPYDLLGNNITNRVRQYRDFLQATDDKYPIRRDMSISYIQYCSSYPLFVVWVDPNQELYDLHQMTTEANVEVHATFSGALAANTTMHAFMFVPTTLEIDGARNCRMVSRDGKPIDMGV